MDSREAREILACFRRGSDDASEPRFAEALELARRDPALAQWFDEQGAFDAALRDRFQQIPVPVDLREQILARLPSRAREIVWWRRPAVRSIAAGIAALAVMAGFWLATRRDNFDAYREEMVAIVSGAYEIRFKSSDFDQIRNYLASRGSPSDYALTPALQGLDTEGVSVIQWRGRNVSLICLDAGADRDLFLFVAHRSVFRDAPATASPQFSRVAGMATASWSAGNHIYFLAGRGDEQFLRQYL